MTLNKLLVAVVLASGSAVATADSFAGLSAGVGLGAVGADSKLSVGPFSLTAGETNTIGLVDVSYALQLRNGQWGVGVGGTYDFNKIKSGKLELGETNFALEGKNHYSVYVQPFFKLNPAAAVFAKVGYHSMKGELLVNGDSVESVNLNGFGYGLGSKIYATKNLYVQAEAGWVEYSSKTKGEVDVKVKGANGVVSVGYNF